MWRCYHGTCPSGKQKRSAYRRACPRHVVEFELAATEDQKRKLFRLNERVRRGSNDAVGEMRKHLEQMKRTKKYRALQKDYKWKADHMDALKKKFDNSADAKNGAKFEDFNIKTWLFAKNICRLTIILCATKYASAAITQPKRNNHLVFFTEQLREAPIEFI